MKNEEHPQFKNHMIDKKIEQSKNIIKQTLSRFSHDKMYVAWTGGKDSATTL